MDSSQLCAHCCHAMRFFLACTGEEGLNERCAGARWRLKLSCHFFRRSKDSNQALSILAKLRSIHAPCHNAPTHGPNQLGWRAAAAPAAAAGT